MSSPEMPSFHAYYFDATPNRLVVATDRLEADLDENLSHGSRSSDRHAQLVVIVAAPRRHPGHRTEAV